jgi:hypothetical protein
MNATDQRSGYLPSAGRFAGNPCRVFIELLEAKKELPELSDAVKSD